MWSAASPRAAHRTLPSRPLVARSAPASAVPVTPPHARFQPPDCLEAIERLRSTLGLTYADLARALVTGESTVHRWRSGSSTPRGANRARLAALDEFVAALERCFPDHADARAWLDTPFAPLGGHAPRQLLATGRAELLAGALAVLATRTLPAPTGGIAASPSRHGDRPVDGAVVIA